MAAPLVATFGCFVILELSYRTATGTTGKKINVQKYEDYTFEGVLTKAKEECSYMSLVNDTLVRDRALHAIKEKIAEKKLKEFYEQKELEKQKAKEFYANLEKESRRRVLEEPRPPRGFAHPRPGPFHPLPPPPHPPFQRFYKRSTEWSDRRRKASSSFSEVSFADHNNCSSRCLFARMEMVDARGFPDESLMTKLIDDKVLNKRIRVLKTKRVKSCFEKMEEVAFDDSCVFSSRLFNCLDLGESLWSGLR